ncbi:Mini-ribonuclease 3 [Gloeothece verrucosa]|uniref:Mini-ribonuclease 3 n=1 Tax=Gloeothece verrucosa (strain PCC 7822) TaxID=497965 RepID=E0UBG8_GLOV7|nr:ribonuclease III domain-containing protein [Gloeothece verrucosa]ADN12800.1 ribonuclease III [Gloeothece verrucosa PCC 7822]
MELKAICSLTAPLLKIGQISPASLAYIGDAVYELYVRTRYLLPPRRLCDYHNQVVAKVRAEQQAAYLQVLEPHLTESEREIVRQGRNAANGRPRRLSPELYQQASSLETLIGYLYLQNPQRLNELLEILEF